jgi:hypothetical protein
MFAGEPHPAFRLQISPWARLLFSLRKILDHKQLSMSLDHANANHVHVGIQEIRPVRGRFHELGMRSRSIARLHNIF